MDNMIHFLIVFDHARGELLSERHFTDAQEAAAAYAEAEERHRAAAELEIVLVGADSIATIHRTHGQYFSGSPLVSKYLAIT